MMDLVDLRINFQDRDSIVTAADDAAADDQTNKESDEDYSSPFYAIYCDKQFPEAGDIYLTPTEVYFNGMKSVENRINMHERTVFASIVDDDDNNYHLEFKFSEDFRRIDDGACFSIGANDGYWGFDAANFCRYLDTGSSLVSIGKRPLQAYFE
jgi:hypothetical protein